ncbi:MAG: hypothetical protein ABSH10_03115 [Phycisphaerae bacterium]|jgi:hypothetical protein
MSTTLSIGLSLGSSKTLLSLRAKLLDTAGQQVGDEIASGFVEIGGGFYLWTYGGFESSFRGGVKFYAAGAEGAALAFCALNPQEIAPAAVSPDAIAAINVDSTGGTLSLAKAVEALVARSVGNADYNAAGGVVTFRGRNGTTPVATLKLTGGGNRTESTIA